MERTGSLFTWQRPKAGLVVWLDYHGPGNAQELAKSVMENEFILVVRSRLKLSHELNSPIFSSLSAATGTSRTFLRFFIE